MGIEIEKKINIISEEEFHELDYDIMGLAFKVHNELGRFCKEKIYQNYFAQLCRENDVASIETEVSIVVSFKSFIKKYYIDVLINNAIIYEFKSVHSLTDEHKGQALNYILLAGINHGKVINFGASSLGREFISTSLTTSVRYDIIFDTDKWEDVDKDSKWLKNIIIDLIKEWGGFLGIQLFYEAIIFFYGGKNNVVRPIKIICNNHLIGTQNFCLLNKKTAFSLSALTKEKKYYRIHLKKLLNHTSLETLQWINFNHHNIEFETIKKNNLK